MLIDKGKLSCPYDYTTLKIVDAELAKYSNAQKTLVSEYIPVQLLCCPNCKRAYTNNSLDSNFIRLAGVKYLTIFQYHSEPSKSQSDMKIGVLVRNTLTKMLKGHEISEVEIALMQTAEYSKETFHLQYPLLRKASRSHGEKVLRY